MFSHLEVLFYSRVQIQRLFDLPIVNSVLPMVNEVRFHLLSYCIWEFCLGPGFGMELEGGIENLNSFTPSTICANVLFEC